MSISFFKKKSTLIVASVAVMGLALTGCGTNSAAAVVATYNGGTVTASQMNEQVHLQQLFDPQLTSVSTTVKKQVIQQYIVYNRLLEAQAVKAGIKVTNAQVNQTVLNIKQSAIQSLYSGNTSSFDTKMQTLGLQNTNLADYVKTLLILQLYSQKLVNKVSLQSEEQYYKQNLYQFATVSVRHILVNKLSLAQQIATQLRNGGSWTKLAKQYSTDTGSKNNGGLYANQSPSQWVVPFRDHAMSQPIGVIGNPFKSQYGYHVMEVLKRTITPFKSVESTIQQTLLQQKTNTVMTGIVKKLQKNADIKYTLS